MLSPRLQAIAHRIQGPRHADIGSDHGHLPLLLCERLPRIIAVEKNAGPLAKLKHALRGTDVEVRLGDGLDPLGQDEIDSLSISGMGALNMRAILERGRSKLPPQLVLQPMDNAQPIRNWARRHGYHLLSEDWVQPYVVLDLRLGSGPDPAYAGLPEEAEFFGPLLLSNLDYVRRQRAWLEGLQRADPRLEFLRAFSTAPAVQPTFVRTGQTQVSPVLIQAARLRILQFSQRQSTTCLAPAALGEPDLGQVLMSRSELGIESETLVEERFRLLQLAFLLKQQCLAVEL